MIVILIKAYFLTGGTKLKKKRSRKESVATPSDSAPIDVPI